PASPSSGAHPAPTATTAVGRRLPRTDRATPSPVDRAAWEPPGRSDSFHHQDTKTPSDADLVSWCLGGESSAARCQTQPALRWIEEHRQLVRRPERQSDDVAFLVRIEAQVRQAVEQRVQRRAGLEQRQMRAGAKVLAERETEVVVVLALQQEAVGLRIVALVAVRRPNDHRQHRPGRDRGTAALAVFGWLA